MAKGLYFEAFSGLSGDMTLGALLHMGLPLEHLRAELARLNLPGYRLEIQPTEQHHISGLKLDVILEQPAEQEHRPVTLIHGIIEASDLPKRVKDRAKQVFWLLAEAEGQIHNVAPDLVHFHEVGAVDAIVDIVGACIGFEYFGVEEFYCSALPVGSGFVRAAHGLMPVPAPATLQLLAGLGAALTPVVRLSGEVEYPARAEMITPTGAALLAALCRPGATNRPAMTLEKVGYGFGSRQFEWPNALRLWLGTTTPQPTSIHNHNHEHTHLATHDETHLHPHDQVDTTPFPATDNEISSIETNLDDMTPEGLGFLLEKLLKAEALDVYFTPIQMKKNRPAVKLSVLARPADEARLANLILNESSTFGVRCSRLSRYTADREFRLVQTSDGPAQLKLKILDGKLIEAVPEYESVAALARQTGRPWRDIYQEVRQTFYDQTETPLQP